MKITIIGIGLIGGSLALSLKRNPGSRIVGYDRNRHSLNRALELGVIDESAPDLQEGVKEADYVFICTPVRHIRPILEELFRLRLPQGCIISDTGSTKANIMEWAKGKVPKGCCFIGGHPMAGSHRSGVEAASSILFENAYYVLTPSQDIPEEKIQALESLLSCTRAKVIRLDWKLHDRIVGAISHYPHLIAAALVNMVENFNQEDSLFHLLAAGGFRDITRIASSNPEMWRDIMLENRGEMLRLYKEWRKIMDGVIEAIEKGDGDAIYRFFEQARESRERIPIRRRGALFTMHDCFVDVPDHPGVIAAITSILAQHHLNISNIEIMEMREDVLGILRLTFRTKDEADKAAEVLKEQGYAVSQP